MSASLLSSCLQGNCNPDRAKETSTEEQGAAQADVKDGTFLVTFCEIALASELILMWGFIM